MIDLLEVWNKAWSKELNERVAQTSVPQSMWKASGRVTKAFPNKEDAAWWQKNGPKQLENWEQFRMNGWQIFDINGTPAIEIEILAMMEDVPVKMALDRVMVTPSGELVIVDIKSGRTTPDWLQLAFYAAGMELTLDIRPKWGTYWMARTGVTTAMIDLDKYPTEDIIKFVKKFDHARKNDIFLPNLSHCSRCGYNQICIWKE